MTMRGVLHLPVLFMRSIIGKVSERWRDERERERERERLRERPVSQWQPSDGTISSVATLLLLLPIQSSLQYSLLYL